MGLSIPARDWWVADMPALSGPLRIAFYGGLLLFAATVGWHDSPLHMVDICERTAPALYKARGLLALLGVDALAHEHRVAFLVAIRPVAIIAWVCVIVGFLQRPAAIITAIGVFALWGVGLGAMGCNHDWYLPVYALVLLCFTRSRDRWSVDYWISRWRRGDVSSATETPSPPSKLADTGFSRQVISLCAVAVLFSAGVAKVLEGGFAWADGISLQSYLDSGWPAWPWLRDWVVPRLWVCQLLSIGTLVVELGAPVALFSRRLRAPVFVAAAAMHLGIWALMSIKYFPQAWCYLLCVAWPRERRLSTAELSGDQSMRFRTASLAGWSLVFALTAVTFLRVEWWPLSHIPMYSGYMKTYELPYAEQMIAGYPASAFDEIVEAQKIAKACAASSCPWLVKGTFGRRAALYFGGEDVDPIHALPLLQKQGQPLESWNLIIREIVMADLAAKPDWDYREDATDSDVYPAQEFVTRLLPALRQARPQPAYTHVMLSSGDILRGGAFLSEIALDE